MSSIAADRKFSFGWRRLFERWLDGIEAGWAIPLLLAGFVVVWTLFLVISYINSDLHPDVTEAWSVGRTFSWGNAKHPPLMGWISNAWSTFLPLTDWSFQLLPMLNAAVALWSVDMITRRFARGDKRAIVMLLLMIMIPAYHFHAQRFNANSVLLAVWPLATLCFLRSFETRNVFWSAAAGVLCAVAMLGKYYSIFLIAGFIFAAVAHPQRLIYLGSRAPWLSVLAGLVALSPHLYWLMTTGNTPFDYAIQRYGGVTSMLAAKDAAKFLLGIATFLVLPGFLWLMMIRFRFREYASNLRELDPGLLLLFLVFLGAIIVPVLIAVSFNIDLTPIWHVQGLFAVVIVAVCAARFPLPRYETVNLALVIAVFSVGALIAAPMHAIYRNTHAFKEGRNFTRLASEMLTKTWREAYGEPLQRVSGDDALAFATAFYSPDHPVYSRPFRYQPEWGIPRVSTLEKGWSALCFTEDLKCLEWMAKVEKLSHDARRFDFAVETSLWGKPGVSTRVSAMMVPPLHLALPANKPSRLHDDGFEDLNVSGRVTQRRPAL